MHKDLVAFNNSTRNCKSNKSMRWVHSHKSSSVLHGEIDGWNSKCVTILVLSSVLNNHLKTTMSINNLEANKTPFIFIVFFLECFRFSLHRYLNSRITVILGLWSMKRANPVFSINKTKINKWDKWTNDERHRKNTK